MESLFHALTDSTGLSALGKGAVLLLASVLAYYVARLVLIRVIHRLARKTQFQWDDVLVEMGVFSALAFFAPAVVVSYGVRIFPEFDQAGVHNGLTVYLTIVALGLFSRTLNAGLAIYEQFPVAVRRPLKGYVQLVKIFVFIIGVVVALALLLGMSPWKLVSGIGAMTAVIMLIFKDTILSFVASIQIAGNDLFRKGDWIEMPAMGADGDVIDIALHTVKVQNWDKTIVSIPTHKFLDHTFKNWRGMQEAKGRRIKRSVLIDQSSIGFLEGRVLDRVKKIGLLSGYLEKKEKELAECNRDITDTDTLPLNGRRLTNIGTLRAYVRVYLEHHPKIRQDMTLLVRHLQPEADAGLPLEIYAFTSDTAWADYEAVQADIFDHILAVLPLFGLRAYQRNALVDARSSAHTE